MKNIQVLKPYYRTQEINELIAECCDSGWTGIGGKMIDFEEAWKKYSGAQTCHMLNSATSGLHLAVYQLKKKYGWKDGDEIVTTPLTFVSTNHAILYNNLKPVFADVDRFGCLDADTVEVTPKTKAILYVGLGGGFGELYKIKNLCDTHGLKLILDAAHMGGTKWKSDQRHFGFDESIEVSVFSGQAVKNLPTSDSGWICWNGDDAEEMDKESRKLSWLGIDKDTFSRTNSQGSYKWYYDVPDLGWKFHANAIDGCFGLVGLKYLDQDNAYRRYLASVYDTFLLHKPKVTVVPVSQACLPSRHLYQILVENRDEVMLALNQCGIYPGVHYRINTVYKMYSTDKKLPKAEEFSEKTISLPLHMHLTAQDAEYVCEKLLEIIK